ncbi:MAG: hypothetical protein ACI3YZ_04275 [Prevotella sp.]
MRRPTGVERVADSLHVLVMSPHRFHATVGKPQPWEYYTNGGKPTSFPLLARQA